MTVADAPRLRPSLGFRLPAWFGERGQLAGIGAIVVALLFVRRPESILHPQFMWEEPWAFVTTGQTTAVLDSLLRPWAGFLQLGPRLVHVIVRPVPVKFGSPHGPEQS